MADESRPRGPYDRPRVVIAGALTLLLAVLMLIDALSLDYSVGEVTLTVLLATLLTLLGIEAADILRGGRG